MTSAPAYAGESAAAFVHALYVLIKAAAVYGPSNEGYRRHAQEAEDALRRVLAEEGAAELTAGQDRLFLNGRLIRFPSEGAAAAGFLLAELPRRGVGAAAFAPEVTGRELDAFVFAFNETSPRKGEGLDAFRARLAESGVTRVELKPPAAPEDEAARAAQAARGEGAGEGGAAAAPASQPQAAPDMGTAAKRTFFQALTVVEDFMTRARAGGTADFAQARTAVRSLVDRVVEDEQAMFELATLHDFDAYTYAHCVNVCVYAVAIGSRLGLDRAQLAELGFAGLFHDVGKARLPPNLIDKPDELTDHEWGVMRRHPVLGVRALLAMKRPFDRALGRAVSVAYEHHLGMDGSGYPKQSRPRRQDLYTRICAIADAFDALTSGRVYMKRPLPPDEALRKLAEGAATSFDPVLLRLFIDAIGAFPVGTVVLLETGELGVVERVDPKDPLRPKVRVFADASGEREPALVDLSRPGAPALARSVDPLKHALSAPRAGGAEGA